MRYLIQLAIPVLIFCTVLWAASRRHSRRPRAEDEGFWPYVAILLIGGAVAVATFFVLDNVLEA